MCWFSVTKSAILNPIKWMEYILWNAIRDNNWSYRDQLIYGLHLS